MQACQPAFGQIGLDLDVADAEFTVVCLGGHLLTNPGCDWVFQIVLSAHDDEEEGLKKTKMEAK